MVDPQDKRELPNWGCLLVTVLFLAAVGVALGPSAGLVVILGGPVVLILLVDRCLLARPRRMATIAVFVCISATILGVLFGGLAAIPYDLADWPKRHDVGPTSRKITPTQPSADTPVAPATQDVETDKAVPPRAVTSGSQLFAGPGLGGLTGLLGGACWSLVMSRRRARFGQVDLVRAGTTLGLAAGVFSTLVVHLGLSTAFAGRLTIEMSTTAVGLVFGAPLGAILGWLGGRLVSQTKPEVGQGQ